MTIEDKMMVTMVVAIVVILGSLIYYTSFGPSNYATTTSNITCKSSHGWYGKDKFEACYKLEEIK